VLEIRERIVSGASKVDWVVIELKRSRREGGRERGKRKDLLRGNPGRFSR